jgi:hypothetical protein
MLGKAGTLQKRLATLKKGARVNWSTGFTLCGGKVVAVKGEKILIQDTMDLNLPFWVDKSRVRAVHTTRPGFKKKGR